MSTSNLCLVCTLLHGASNPVGFIWYVIFKWYLCFIYQLIIFYAHKHGERHAKRKFVLKWSINMKDQDLSTSFVFMYMLNNCVFRVGILWLPDSEIITSLSYSWIISCSNVVLSKMWIYRWLTWCGAAVVKINLYLCWLFTFPDSNVHVVVSICTHSPL